MKKNFKIIFYLSLLFVFSPILACSPDLDSLNLEYQVEKAKNIFVGKILKSKDFSDSFGSFEITVQVVRPLKTEKKKGEIVIITTKSNSGSCGYDDIRTFSKKLDFIFFTDFNFETTRLSGNEQVHYEKISDLEKNIKKILNTEEMPENYHFFNDISSFHKNATAIKYMQEQGIVKGYNDGSFKPAHLINRAEFTKIIVESQFYETEIEYCPLSSLKFSDVKKTDWFAKYICVAKNNGLIEGYDDGSFKPEKNIIFTEAAKIISQAFRFPQNEGRIWYEGFVKNLEKKSAIPLSINKIDKSISRGEMAEIIYRLKTETSDKPTQKSNDLILVCGEDLKICEDGSMVKRIFPSCEFSVCEE